MSFNEYLNSQFQSRLESFKQSAPLFDHLKVDLHCHDYNSDEPDELIGRILNIPETWISTKDLVSTLKKNGCDLITITNHNNARSCYRLQEEGMDVLVGCEFSCTVPDFNIGIHVLVYGFSPEQEIKLLKLRQDLYKFLRYSKEQNLPTIWAHPLFYYSQSTPPPLEFFMKLSLLFDRFEAINGQRNTWQNYLTIKWIDSLSEEKLYVWSKDFNINSNDYCMNPIKKQMTGGSDSHMGIFSGLTGTQFCIPHLEEKLRQGKLKSDLVLQSLCEGQFFPYGRSHSSERLTICFLDYFCQIAMNMKDPGLIRMILHKGKPNEKILGFILSNMFSEMKQHKNTMRFLKVFHESFRGKEVGFFEHLFLNKDYQPISKTVSQLAQEYNKGAENFTAEFLNQALHEIYNQFSQIFFSRLTQKSKSSFIPEVKKISSFEELINVFELPTQIRSYLNTEPSASINKLNVNNFLDRLSFPLLGQIVLFGANFTATHVLNASRPLLNELSDSLNLKRPKEKILWLTDTFDDKNGVSKSLQFIHQEIKKRNLSIDILVCSNTIQSDSNLVIIKPEIEFVFPFYKDQPIRIPNLMEIHKLFRQGEYTSIISSTEGVMGIIALILKQAYCVPAYSFLHTDWIIFLRSVLKLEAPLVNRVRRILRAYYHRFDGHFVLNSDHKKWLTRKGMDLDPNRIEKIAHWVPDQFNPVPSQKKPLFGLEENDFVLLYVGRLSLEKGINDLASIYYAIKKNHPLTRLVVIGQGPAQVELKEQIPDLIDLGWVDYSKLNQYYSSADFLLLPSRFDTFGRVVLEAMSCGLPVAAYAKMGPKDIIENKISGLLEKNKESLAQSISDVFDEPQKLIELRNGALARSQVYTPDSFFQKLNKIFCSTH